MKSTRYAAYLAGAYVLLAGAYIILSGYLAAGASHSVEAGQKPCWVRWR